MSIEPSFRKPSPAIVRNLVVAAIAMGIVGLQVTLPLASYYFCSAALNNEPIDNDFWFERLSFEGFLDPESLGMKNDSDYSYFYMISATVCQNELLVLFEKKFDRSGRAKELVRVNLRTGLLTSTPTPAEIRHLVSDGQTLWLTPDDDNVWDPFVLDGRPVAITRDGRNWNRLREFVDGRWRSTSQYALAPTLYINFHNKQSFLVQHLGGPVQAAVYATSELYYNKGLEFGSKEQLDHFVDQYGKSVAQMTPEQYQGSGWSCIQLSGSDEVSLGHWFKKGQPCLLSVDESDDFDTSGYYRKPGFRIVRILPDGTTKSKIVKSPVRWEQITRVNSKKEGPRVVTFSDGNVLILSHAEVGGRIHILHWDGQRLRFGARLGDPLILWVCLDGGLLAILALVIPMIVLGVIGSAVPRWWDIRFYSSGHLTVEFASVARRGIARTIDLTIMLSPIFLSIVLHFDAFGWWNQVVSGAGIIRDYSLNFVFDPNWNSFEDVESASIRFLFDIASAPVISWLVLLAISITISQIVWQAYSGRTIGKWLLGIRVLRTTLRPCGLARSLLREILLFIDSLMLLSWVPGVIAVLTTTQSQRIGDLVADTVVVRDWLRSPVMIEPKGSPTETICVSYNG